MATITGATKPHVWVPAPPGQGSQPVCKRCGVRKSVAEANGEIECPGVGFDNVTALQSEYDPI